MVNALLWNKKIWIKEKNILGKISQEKKLKKRIKSKEIIRKATSSMNNTKSGKYGLEPEIIEK